jgi:hypothetical protein
MLSLFRNRCTKPSRRPRLALEALEDRAVPAVFNVNSLADILNPGAGTVTLRSAIAAANATPGADTINLTLAGTYRIALAGANEDHNASGDFDILAAGGNLSIVNTSGGRAAVDGGNLDRVFDINPTFDPAHPNATALFKVTLQGLTVQHGLTTGGGAGIQDTGNASLELDNCVITGNVAVGAGGGVLMQNTVNTPWTLTVNNSFISNNHAGDAGGGIDTIGSGHVVVTGSQLTGNTCLNQGAAIWLDTLNNASATLLLSNSLVNRNFAFLGATGALGTAGNGAVTIIGTTVSDNYSGTTGGGFGDENGLANLTIINSQFLNNTAMTDGGGVQAGGAGTTTLISGSLFAGNTAAGNGGGLFASGGTVSISTTRFIDNTALNGGGIEDRASALTLSFSELDNNRIVSPDPAALITGGGLNAEIGITSVTIASTLFLDNTAENGDQANGGAINQTQGTLTVTGSQFTGNRASFDSGAVNFTGTTLTVTGSTFNDNHAAAAGALFLVNNGAANLTNDTFAGNTASGDGGALNVQNTGVATLLNDTITGNTAGAGGGILTFPHGGQTVVLQNTLVALNTATMKGPDISSNGVNFIDHGGNFIGTLSGATGFGAGTLTGNPKLGRLENNGGPTVGLPGFGHVILTVALQPGSRAIGQGTFANGAPTIDERGFPRPAGGRATPSIGAYEPQYAANASANTVFVENVFEVLLGRPATLDPQAAVYVNLLNQGATPESIVRNLEAGVEYRTDQVNAVFQRFLHHAANAQELQIFVPFLATGTVEQMETIVVSSLEYFQLHGGTNDGFVNALIEDALNRPAGANEVAYWMQSLGSKSPAQVAALVFGSREYLTNLVADDFVSLLGRPGGVNLKGVVDYLQAGGTDQMALSLLLGSAEAFATRTM